MFFPEFWSRVFALPFLFQEKKIRVFQIRAYRNILSARGPSRASVTGSVTKSIGMLKLRDHAKQIVIHYVLGRYKSV